MKLLLAVASGIVLLITFGAERIIKRLAKGQLDEGEKPTPEETNNQIHKNLAVLSSRNKRLTYLSLLAFAGLAIIQIFSIIAEADDQPKKTMDDIQNINKRVTKIEHFLWGGDGNVGGSPPPAPSGLDGRLKLLEETVRANQAETKANANSLNKFIVETAAQLEELRKQVQALRGQKRPVRRPTHSR
jgi:hypothetical protein